MAAYASGFTVDGKLKYLPLHRALKVYAEKSHRQTLINLLTPVHRAAAQCSWVSRLVSTNAIYYPMQWSSAEAYEFLRTTDLLISCGIAVRLPDWWKKHPRPRVSVTIGEKKTARFGRDTLLDFDMRMTVADQVPMWVPRLGIDV
ncbi:hypothetical protein JXA80_07775 [bacterium]|nr:hypothetical protein [candidate division CSSED10-310 bacterium]